MTRARLSVQPAIRHRRLKACASGGSVVVTRGTTLLAAYGPNYRRLQAIKSLYDPANIVYMNQNIRPLAWLGGRHIPDRCRLTQQTRRGTWQRMRCTIWN
ncbi:MAG: BBE domain-containing protein [Rhodopila sp.]